MSLTSQQTIICSKSTIITLEKGVCNFEHAPHLFLECVLFILNLVIFVVPYLKLTLN